MKPVLLQCASGKLFRQMVEKSSRRHHAYCERFGFEHIVRYRDPETCFSDVMWWRVECLKHTLEIGAPFVVFLDSDAFIKSFFNLQTALPPEWAWLGLSVSPVAHVRDAFHLNFGVSYWRSCEESIAFLTELLTKRINMPLGEEEYHEQGCVNRMLLDWPGCDRWQKGFRLLGNEWNSHARFEKSVDRAYVVGAHGTHDDRDKINIFHELLERFPLI